MLSILLIDDHELFRAGIKFLLAELAPDVRFSEAHDCSTALELAMQGKFDIILLDYHLPGPGGLEALSTLRQQIEDSVIVILSAEDDPALIRQIIDAGAAGFIPKASSHAIMMAALRLILAGGTYLPSHALHGVQRTLDSPPAIGNTGVSLKNLTERQVETLRLAIQGKANKVIAREMNVSEATVKAHLSASFRALGVRNRTEAVFAAAKMGLSA